MLRRTLPNLFLGDMVCSDIVPIMAAVPSAPIAERCVKGCAEPAHVMILLAWWITV